VHVKSVADDFRRDLLGLQHGAGEAGRAVAERRHAVEEMRRVARAGGDRLERLLVGRAGVAERHPMPARGEPAHEIESAVQLRRDRHDSNVRRCALDLLEDVGAVKVRRP